MKGNQKQILMFVGGLVLVLFVYHMLKGVCGCKLVEGIDEEIRCKPNAVKTKGMKFANYQKLNEHGVIEEKSLLENKGLSLKAHKAETASYVDLF